MKVVCINNIYPFRNSIDTAFTKRLLTITVGNIYETSDTAKYKGDMYFIPSLSMLVPKELFKPLDLIRQDKLNELCTK